MKGANKYSYMVISSDCGLRPVSHHPAIASTLSGRLPQGRCHLLSSPSRLWETERSFVGGKTEAKETRSLSKITQPLSGRAEI